MQGGTAFFSTAQHLHLSALQVVHISPAVNDSYNARSRRDRSTLFLTPALKPRVKIHPSAITQHDPLINAMPFSISQPARQTTLTSLAHVRTTPVHTTSLSTALIISKHYTHCSYRVLHQHINAGNIPAATRGATPRDNQTMPVQQLLSKATQGAKQGHSHEPMHPQAWPKIGLPLYALSHFVQHNNT